ncbi:MAG: ATP-binding protein, partial [Thermoplasmata archaeon]
EFRRYEETVEARPRVERGVELFKRVSLILSAFVGILGVIAVLVRDLFSTLVFLLVFFAWSAALGLWLRDARRTGQVEKAKQKLIRMARKIGLLSETIEDLSQEFEEATTERRTVSRALHEHFGILRDRLELEGEDHNEVFERASRTILEREKTIDPEAPSDFEEEEYNRVQAELSEVREELASLREELDMHRKFLHEVSEDLADLNFERFLGEPLDLVIRNFESLRLLVRALEEFTDSVEDRANECRQAVAVWHEIEEEEEQKVAELFGPDSNTSKIFAEITEGRYDAVEYDPTTRDLILRRPNGAKLPATSVSRGTCDQLYFAIRMALGHRVLGGEPGFFLLDEAFLSSDERRLANQIQFLSRLADSGWQVIYLTAKGEIERAIGDPWKRQIITMELLP